MTVQTSEGEGRILLMDDEEIILKTTGPLLRRLGYEVDLARNGEEALVLYRRSLEDGKPYTVVIMDLSIPGGMGGEEAIGQLREMNPGVRAIVTSGYFEDSFLDDHQQHGFSAIIAKPYKVAELGALVRSVIHSES